MNDPARGRDGVPEDYPGRIVGFPDHVTHLVIALLGIQSNNAEDRNAFLASVLRHAAGRLGPAHIERVETVDDAGVPTNVAICYWVDRDAAAAWWDSEAVSRWWRSLDKDGESGFFLERMTVPRDRFNYAAGTEDRHGSAAVLELEPSATFGYWGAYRDRLPASANDDFSSPLTRVPALRRVETRGFRLSVTVPDNLCYIREGQGWANCEQVERRIWETEMNPVIDRWVNRLGADPAATGCLAVRDCREHDRDDGGVKERRTQLAFLLSLAHIEQAARTDRAHLAVHSAFVRMYTEPQFTPRMHVWVELAVLKSDEFESQYINCHAETGLLPYFPAVEIAG